MKANLVKGTAILVLLLAVSMAVVPPVSASETGQTVCNSCCSCCSSCGDGNADECLVNLNVAYEELEGAEKHKTISNTLKNEEVKKLRSKLIEEGYTPAFNYAVAVNVVIQETGDDPYTYQATTVVLPFRSKDEGGSGAIISISDAEETRTFATTMNVIDVDDNDEIDIEVYIVDEQGNVVTGPGSGCLDYCIPLAVAIFWAGCCIVCPGTCLYNPLLCVPLCGAIASTLAAFACKEFFCEQPYDWCDLACAAVCGAICSPFGALEGLVCSNECGELCDEMMEKYCH